MTEIHFTIEFNKETDSLLPSGKIWTYIDSTPVVLDYGSNARCCLNSAANRKLCILGHPILNDRINNHEFAEIYLSADRDIEFFRRINGEFLLIEIDEWGRSLRVINCRFASPIFWYASHANYFLGSTSYYHLCRRLKELNQFRLEPENFYEFLNFRRVFGEKTYDKDSLYLKPAHVLTFTGNRVRAMAYWNISYKKSAAPLSDNAEKLVNAIQSSIRRKSSDNKRYGLFLSGGMDTRTILANCTAGETPHCFTLTYSKNSREYKVAKALAEWKGAEHTWIRIQAGHDRKYLNECARLTGAMYMTPALFLGHEDLLQQHVDVLFAGYGFDYFFQGMYVPTKMYSLLGKRLNLKRIHKISAGDLAAYFIHNISYRTKGLPIDMILKKNKLREMNSRLEYVISEIISRAKNISEDTFDIWEYINFSNLSRHYTYGGQMELMTLSEYRTISYDNDIYDLYLELPAEQRFDAKIMREVLRRVNIDFYNYKNANNDFPVKYSFNQRAFLQILRSLRRRITIRRASAPEITPDNFTRTWLPIDIVLKNEMPDFVTSLKKSDELESLGIFDMDGIRSSVNLWLENKTAGDQTLLILLTIERFLKAINADKRNADALCDSSLV